MQAPSPNKLRRIIEAYSRRLAQAPEDLFARLQVARALRLNGNLAESVQEYGLLARQLIRVGDLQGAQNACQSILELVPEHAETQQLLTSLQGRSGGPRPHEQVVPGVLEEPPVAVPLLHVVSRASAAPPASATVYETAMPKVAVPSTAPPLPPVRETSPFASAAADRRPRGMASLPPPAGVEVALPSVADDGHPVAPIELVRPRRLSVSAPPDDDSLERQVTGVVVPPPRPSQPEARPVLTDHASAPLLRLLDEETLTRLTEQGRHLALARGETALREGQVKDALFLVLRGNVSASRQQPGRLPLDLGLLPPGSFFGEFGLLQNIGSPATYLAQEEAALLELSRDSLEPVLALVPRVRRVLEAALQRRSVSVLVGSSALLRELPLPIREEIASLLQPRSFRSGEEIISLDEEGASLVLIQEGRVEELVRTFAGAEAKVIAHREAGDVTGLSAAVNHGGSPLLVRATAPTQVLLLSGAYFRRLLRQHPQLEQVTHQLVRLREFVALQQIGLA